MAKKVFHAAETSRNETKLRGAGYVSGDICSQFCTINLFMTDEEEI
jgi:hypothetical protein